MKHMLPCFALAVLKHIVVWMVVVVEEDSTGHASFVALVVAVLSRVQD